MLRVVQVDLAADAVAIVGADGEIFWHEFYLREKS